MGGGYLPDYMSEGDDIVDLDEAGKPFFDSEDKDEVDCIHCKDKAHEHQACPYYGISCNIEGCPGVMEVVVGVSLDGTMKDLLLKCEVRRCPGIEWIYENKWIGLPEDKPVPYPFRSW
ncbi:hypothetical protein ACHQM5_007725 [Ranunculus cassubicifolius]